MYYDKQIIVFHLFVVVFQPNKDTDKRNNRDSGICSFESYDGQFRSLERPPKLPTTPIPSTIPHPDPNVIYSTVRKTSTPAIKLANQIKQTGPIEVKVAGPDSRKNKPENKRGSAESVIDDDRFMTEFERRLSLTNDKAEESLVDEIMSHINYSHINDDSNASYDEICDLDLKDYSANYTTEGGDNAENSGRVADKDVVEAGAQGEKVSENVARTKSNVQDSCDLSGIEKKTDNVRDDKQVPNDEREDLTEFKKEVEGAGKQGVAKRCIAMSHSDTTIEEQLAELRTRLVQLKQDRLVILSPFYLHTIYTYTVYSSYIHVQEYIWFGCTYSFI